MTSKRRELMQRVPMMMALFLSAAFAMLSVERADASTIALTNYNSTQGIKGTFDGTSATEYGGVIQATLDGVALDFVYCVEPFVNIGLDSYTTTVTTDGTIHGYTVNNADRLSWLMTNIAPTLGSDTTLQAALQAAIWTLVDTSSRFVFDRNGNSAALVAAYDSYLASSNGQSAPLANTLWMGPIGTDGQPRQGLIAMNPTTVSEPGTLALFGAGLLGFGLVGRRKVS